MDIGAAQLSGVRTPQIYAIVYALSAGLAGVAGTLISLSYALTPTMGRESSIAGLPLKVQQLDINTVGAGGGSIAWFDAGGALRVGPKSAGAAPGRTRRAPAPASERPRRGRPPRSRG